MTVTNENAVETDTNLKNFKSWYSDILNELYPERQSGFVVLMVTFPLLERYLRHKTGLNHKDTLNEGFMDGLCVIFPVLHDRQTTKEFWNVYRNGILHQVSLARENRKSELMPVGWLSHDIHSAISVESDGSFLIHPVLFSKHVVTVIENDFTTFEFGRAHTVKLPMENFHPTAKKLGTENEETYVLGTNTEI